MGVFVTAINKLIIIFLLVLIGCFAKKKDIIDDCFIDKFSGFLTKIVVPCFIISSMQLSYTPELLQKGIDKEIIAQVVEELEPNPVEKIKEIIEKKYLRCLQDEKGYH